MTWKNSGDGVLKRYSYQYDAYNRLKAAIYQEPESFVPQNGFYNEFMSYDANGNITGLKRNQKGYTGTVEEIDELVYSYPTGNRLESVVDLKNNYAGYPETSGNIISYDDNGSMTSHIDKGILEIKYNILDLPSYVKFNNYVERLGQNVYRNMNYTYRADGVKVKKVHHYFSGKKSQDAFITTEYVDGFQYSIDTANLDLLVPNLKFFATSEGYFDFANNRYIYHYNDHLGNVRVSFAREGNIPVIVQQNDYYAFGLRHSYGISAIGDYKYQYNGKELQEELGMYDYGARFYMPDIGRWGVIDPLAEMYNPFTPYAYVANNPINYYDPDGMRIEETSTGWTFTGSDINLLHSYLTTGTSMGSNYNNLMQHLNSFDFSGGSGGGGGISSFWSSFNGGDLFGGVTVGNNGSLSWWTNMPQTGISGDIQGLINHRSNLRSDDGNNECLTCPKNTKLFQMYTTESYSVFEKEFWTWEHFGKRGRTYYYANGEWQEIKPILLEVPIGIGGPGKGAFKLLSKENIKSINTYKNLIIEHQQKLTKYILNPKNYDNLGILKNAPNQMIRNKIIQSRINHLKHEIKTFHKNINDILNGK